MLAGAVIPLCVDTASAKPAFVQANYAAPQVSRSLAAISYANAQIARDMNVVVVGWSDTTAQISSVTDTAGNIYQLAIGPTQLSGTASQSIYYAKQIVGAPGGVNAVTVTFSTAATFPDVRILEYSGIDPLNPVDVVAGATGASGTSDSGVLTTRNGTDLLLGANYVQTSTTGPGSGFTQRLITDPDSDIAEDRLVTATGSYSATAPLGSSGWWVMQMAAFRSAAPTPTPTSTSVNLSWDANAPTNDPSTNTVGYRLHIGHASGNYSQIIDVGSSTAAAVPNLAAGTSYYFVVVAYNSAGVEGPYSNEVSYSAP